MVDVIPVLLLIFGAVSFFKPEWVATLHRRQKAAGTTHQPRDLEVTDSWLAVTRISGIVFLLFGLFFAIRSL